MNFSFDKFLRPLTSSDKNIKIYDDTNNIRYVVNPHNVKSINISNNLITINLDSNRNIVLDFDNKNESKKSAKELQLQLDTLKNSNVPYYIQKSVEDFLYGYTGSFGSTGSNGTSGTSGINGLTGSNGTSGTSGINGSIGINGATGSNGTSGTSGINGATGSTGPIGPTGSGSSIASNLMATTTKTSDYSIVLTDYTLRVDASSNDVTMTLPSSSTAYDAGYGYVFAIKRVDASSNKVYLTGTASELIDGLTQSILYQYDTYTVQSNGTSWDIL